MSEKQLGFIGVGRMGMHMAGRLLEAGYELAIYDTDERALARLEQRGARRSASPADVASVAETVLVSLPTPDIVRSVALADSGVIQGKRVKTFIDLSTTGPRVANEVAEALAPRGIAAVDAPVSGRPPTMTVMAGGAAPVFAKYRPLFAAMAGNIFHVGEAGAGCIAKLVTQYLGYTNFVAALEGMLIGAKAGIDLAQLACIVPLAAPSTSSPRTSHSPAIWRARSPLPRSWGSSRTTS